MEARQHVEWWSHSDPNTLSLPLPPRHSLVSRHLSKLDLHHVLPHTGVDQLEVLHRGDLTKAGMRDSRGSGGLLGCQTEQASPYTGAAECCSPGGVHTLTRPPKFNWNVWFWRDGSLEVSKVMSGSYLSTTGNMGMGHSAQGRTFAVQEPPHRQMEQSKHYYSHTEGGCDQHTECKEVQGVPIVATLPPAHMPTPMPTHSRAHSHTFSPTHTYPHTLDHTNTHVHAPFFDYAGGEGP